VPDRITLRGVRAHAHHGVYAFERERGQMFRVDAVLELDTVAAAAGDDLGKTVNYADLAQRLHAVLTGEPVNLLETLAQRLADVCLAELGVPFDDVTVAIRRERA
jgi:7,8-dihydroneopterin aldolase/epimerase/oxygenase